MKNSLTCSELKDLDTVNNLVVDVMTPEDYAACHIAGAKNACIYEMAFLERIAACAPDLSTAIVVYDVGGSGRAAATARERLNQAGYEAVAILEGGLAAWRAAGLPFEAGNLSTMAEPVLQDGAYLIDTEKSRLEWMGRNLNNRHYGQIAIREGALLVRGGTLAEGSITLDMNSIANLDLQDPEWRDMLIIHLLSDDFFAVKRFPAASFRLTGFAADDHAPQEAPSGTATGDLTIRDVTRQITFPAIVAPQADGTIKAHAAFDIDRTLWNVCYGSGKLFERLGMHLVHDIISLELFVLARRSE
jgi:polyisoprenoid-binding protein YceI